MVNILNKIFWYEETYYGADIVGTCSVKADGSGN